MKCPACSMQVADDALYCDFCKEPFRKARRPRADAPAEAGAPKLPDPGKMPPAEALEPGAQPPLLSAAVPGLGFRVPRWVRPLAWTFFLIVMIGVVYAVRFAMKYGGKG